MFNRVLGDKHLKFLNRIPTSNEYNNLRINSGMGNEKKKSMVDKAMLGSLLIVGVYENEELIGFGRIVGDGGITFAVTDIMVDKKFQRQGIADKILDIMDDWFDVNTNEDCFIMLHANIPADKLYLKHRFEYLGSNKIGMLRK